jgi:hypothetical protein
MVQHRKKSVSFDECLSVKFYFPSEKEIVDKKIRWRYIRQRSKIKHIPIHKITYHDQYIRWNCDNLKIYKKLRNELRHD